jgi:predicted Zn-dependent protease
MKKYTGFIYAASALFLIQSCATNPVTGRREVALVSEGQELNMGKEADPQIVAQYGLYPDKGLQDFISQKGKEMVAVSHRPNIAYEFKIVDSDVLNAFAIPGYVYFTRGIMAHFNNEAEFAGVLGHEIGHITARHSVSQQSKALLGQIGLIGAMVVRPELAQFGETASQGLGLLFLKFGRDAERQSDQLGVEYSTKIGYDASEMAGFFSTLERKSEESGAQELPNFLSTHPNPGERNATVAKLAVEWKKKQNLTNPQVNRNAYLKRIEGLVYGEDPKQGFLENNVFYHPELKFQFSTPANWNYQNTPQQVQFAPKDGKALMFMTLAQGSSLQEAASATLQKYKLVPLESRETSVNGLPAIAVVADQQQQQQGQQQQPGAGVRTLSYFIQYGGVVYHLIGVSSQAEFNMYSQTFTNTMQSFRQLTDAAKLNRQPDRVRIKTLTQDGTLEQALRRYNVPDSRIEEMAILNGMRRTDKVEKGTSIKVVER